MKPLFWQDNRLILLDQTFLPAEEIFVICTDHRMVGDMIRKLGVRGAPAIGAAAAYGLVLAAREGCHLKGEDFQHWMNRAAQELAETRPTAVNLFWALKRMTLVYRGKEPPEALDDLLTEARKIQTEDEESCRRIGDGGLALLRRMERPLRILTHCNAGALATAGDGTALAIIRRAWESGILEQVYAGETRPLLQGARLTAYELMAEQIPVTLITDNMAAWMMGQEEIDIVITGADRIAANGDAANKIGTYGLAVLAHHHQIPFYIAAPFSTFDPETPNGDHILVEERDGDEVRRICGVFVAPADVPVRNPAFDITPHHLVDGIISDRGVIERPDAEQMKLFFEGKLTDGNID